MLLDEPGVQCDEIDRRARGLPEPGDDRPVQRRSLVRLLHVRPPRGLPSQVVAHRALRHSQSPGDRARARSPLGQRWGHRTGNSGGTDRNTTCRLSSILRCRATPARRRRRASRPALTRLPKRLGAQTHILGVPSLAIRHLIPKDATCPNEFVDHSLALSDRQWQTFAAPAVDKEPAAHVG